MDNKEDMSVKIVTVAKELPEYSKETPEIIPLLDGWLEGQEDRFVKKVKKIFEGAAVDKRYSIMEPAEVFTATSFVAFMFLPISLKRSSTVFIIFLPPG